MAGMTTGNSDMLTRTEVWSTQLKDVLTDELMAKKFVRWIDFPDGNTFTIPSIGELDSYDYVENEPIQYQALDTGEFQFSITEYVQSGTYITNKNKQDLFYMSELVSSFVPKMSRALAERLEADIFKQGQPGVTGGQTVANLNLINNRAHRWVGQDTANSKHVIGVKDFARAALSLEAANVPQSNLIAIVDPSVAYYLSTLTTLTDLSNNRQWEGIIETGLSRDMRFIRNIYGFDVYSSNRLALCGSAQTGASETIDSVASGANCVCCLLFSATSDLLPFVGSFRQMPKVDSKYNMDFQREEYAVTSRYGLKRYRPENFITVLHDPSFVS